MKKPAAAMAALALAAPALAADDSQVWMNSLVQAPLGNGVLLWFDTSFRLTEESSRLGQTLLRVGLGTRLSKDLMVHGGYLLGVTEPAGRPQTVEHRVWQQAFYPIISGERATIIGRTRLEQRFQEGAGGIGLRARQLFRLQVPLDDGGPTFLAWHELVLTIAAADWGPETGFDQHRSFLGFAVPIRRGVVLEPGYFEQRFPQAEPDTVNRAFNMTLVARF